MKLTKVIAGLALIASTINPVTASASPSVTDSPSVITYSTTHDVDPCTDHDELCYTLPSESAAWSLYEAYDVPSIYPEAKAIYMGYFDSVPALDEYEGYVSDGQHYYVFTLIPSDSLTA